MSQPCVGRLPLELRIPWRAVKREGGGDGRKCNLERLEEMSSPLTRNVSESEGPTGRAILAPLPGDSPLGECLLRGEWLGRTEARIGDGTAFFVQMDEGSQDLV